MGLKGELWLRALLVLFCRLLLADVICCFIGDWLLYFILVRGLLKSKQGSINIVGGSGLKVIACGFPRSGTMSLKLALDSLGFPCYHDFHVFKPGQSKLLMKAKTFDDWQHILQGYSAIASIPAAFSYKQLMKLYPDAKVILNVRDPEKWYNSYSRTCHKIEQSLILQIIGHPNWHRYFIATFRQGIFKDNYEDKEFAIATYQRHMQEVKEHVPPEKLMVYEIGTDGWSPLCDFLQVPVPNLPFPSVNESNSHHQFLDRKIMLYSMVLAFYVAFLSCALAFLLTCKFVYY